jgi:hypothetical protein
MITHEEKCKAADWVAFDQTPKDNEHRKTLLSLGAFRAFEWLEKNGYTIEKKETP